MRTQPLILRQGSYSLDDIKNIQNDEKIWKTVDALTDQLHELFEVRNADQLQSSNFADLARAFVAAELGAEPKLRGDWVYVPSSGTLIHGVSEVEYFELRTNRNRNLITIEEQRKLHQACVSIAGLSVGGAIAVGAVYAGVCGRLKLADHDVLETANLNRVRASLSDLGQSKLDITARQVYDIDPYQAIDRFEKGIHIDNLGSFLSDPAPDVVFDEIDDFEMKIRLRLAARAAKIPVIMLTSIGDTIQIDVERFDLEPERELFHGALGDLPDQMLAGNASEADKVRYAARIVGMDIVPTRALGSLLEINSTLVGRPQLYSTVTLDGGLAGYLIRRLVLGWELPSMRVSLSLDEQLGVTEPDADKRSDIIATLMKRGA